MNVYVRLQTEPKKQQERDTTHHAMGHAPDTPCSTQNSTSQLYTDRFDDLYPRTDTRRISNSSERETPAFPRLTGSGGDLVVPGRSGVFDRDDGVGRELVPVVVSMADQPVHVEGGNSAAWLRGVAGAGGIAHGTLPSDEDPSVCCRKAVVHVASADREVILPFARTDHGTFLRERGGERRIEAVSEQQHRGVVCEGRHFE